MHEFELGVWKSLLTHLVCILHSLGPKYVQEFNSQYVPINTPRLINWISFWQVAPFGHSTIHCFTHNVAELKKLAAQDFEDILQVNSAPISSPTRWQYVNISAAYHALRVYYLHHTRNPHGPIVSHVLLAFSCKAMCSLRDNSPDNGWRHSYICSKTSLLRSSDLHEFQDLRDWSWVWCPAQSCWAQGIPTTWPCSAIKRSWWEAAKDLQLNNIQTTFSRRLCHYNQDIWDNRLLQHSDSKFFPRIMSHITFPSHSWSWHALGWTPAPVYQKTLCPYKQASLYWSDDQ